MSQRQKTATFRFDPETHSLLDQLAVEYGQNKTQVMRRMIREETARKKKSSPIEFQFMSCPNPECSMHNIEIRPKCHVCLKKLEVL